MVEEKNLRLFLCVETTLKNAPAHVGSLLLSVFFHSSTNSPLLVKKN